MKKITTFSLALFTTAAVFGQAPQRVAPASVVNAKASYGPRFEQLMKSDEPILRAKDVAPASNHYGVRKTAAVNPVELGRSTNAYSILRPEQNQVLAVDSLNTVVFIHRQDVTVFGGGSSASGKLRYDLSIDGGSTFINDIGELNPTYTRPSRYPNVAGWNAAGNTNPYSAKLIVSAPVLDPSPDWDGHLNGVSDIAAASPATTEHYDFLSSGTYLQGGLTQGMPGEYWSVDWRYDGSAVDSLRVYKGIYSAGDITWTRVASVWANYNTSIDGSVTAIGPNIAFAPNGMTGYIGFLSDLNGGVDSVVAPCFMKTTDGGATWGNPIEVNLNNIPWVADSLQQLWVDSLGNPASDGKFTCAFDYDITVDINGNPHMAVVIGTRASGTPYSISSGLAKFMVDVNSPDGGTTWDAHYVSSVYTFRGEFGVPDANGDLLSMDNQPQISRTRDGSIVFYSWADSDSSAATGGVGFGVSDNLVPNLRIAGWDVVNNNSAAAVNVTGGDLVFEGKALWPTMAPEMMISDLDGSYQFPIVIIDLLSNDQLQPCRYWYFGNDAVLTPADFGPVANDNAVQSDVVLHQSYPNPTNGLARIKFELPIAAAAEMTVTNMYGQTVATLINGAQAAGAHEVVLNTADLAPGVYFYNLKVADKVYTNKMVVVK